MRNWSCDIWLFNFCNGIVKHLHIMKWQNHFINHNVHNYHETLSCNRQLCLWMCHVHTVYVYIFMYMYVQCIISPLEHWIISDGIFTPTQLFPIREDWGLRGREITRNVGATCQFRWPKICRDLLRHRAPNQNTPTSNIHVIIPVEASRQRQDHKLNYFVKEGGKIKAGGEKKISIII